MSSIHFETTFDNSRLIAGIRQSNQSIAGWAQNATHSGESVENMFRRVSQAATAYISLRFGAQIGREIINVRGEFQQLGIAFETMLGSKAKADALMNEAVTFAAKTPFTLTDVATNIKQLMAMGIATEDVMGTMKSLGDVASGVSVPISRVAINYGQVATMGKLQGRELRDFAMAGIPLVDELAKNLGKAKNEILGMVEAGQIGFKDVERAFQTMAGEGGKFYNLMEKQNASVTGQISNLQDKIQVMLNSIGKSNEGLIYGGISGLSNLVANYQDVIDVLKVLVATYGTYKAALIAVSATQAISGFVENIRLIAMLRRELGLLTAAQQAFNVASKGNIYIAMLAAIVGLVSALVIFNKETKTTQDLIDDLNDSVSQIGKQQEINGLINKYDELKSKTALTKDEQAELNKTIKELSVIFPDAKTELDEYGNAIDLFRENLEKTNKEFQDFIKNSTKNEINEGQKKLNELIERRNKLLQDVNTGKISIFTGKYVEGKPEFKEVAISPELAKKETEEIKKLANEINDLSGKIIEAKSKLTEINKIDATEALKPYKDLFKEISEYTEKQLYDTKAKLTGLLGEGLGTDAEEKIKKQIDAIAAQLKLPSVKEQIEETIKAIAEGEAKLKEMRSAGSTSTITDIETQDKAVKELKTRLETLTGVKKKEQDKQLKNEQEYADKMRELIQAEVDLQFTASQSKIDAMKEGTEKELAQLKLNHEKELAELDKQREEFAKRQFDANPDNKDKTFNPSLPGLSSGQEIAFSSIKSNTLKNQQIELAEFYKKALSDYQTYAEAVKSLNEKYNTKKQGLISVGASKENLSELERQRKEALEELSTQFAERSESYENWLAGVAAMSINTLRLELANAQKILLATTEGKTDTNNSQNVAQLRAKIAVLENTIRDLSSKKTKKDGNPAKASIKEWKDLQEALRDVGSEFEKIGDEVGGLAGKIISESGQIATSTLQMIDGITTLANWSVTSTQMAAQGASKAIIAVEKASVILAIVSTAIQIASKIINLLKGQDKSARDTEELKKVSEQISDVYDAINKQLEKRIELIKSAKAAEVEYLDTLNKEAIASAKNYYQQLFSGGGNNDSGRRSTDTVYGTNSGLLNNEIFGKEGKNNDLTVKDVMNMFGLSGIEDFAKWWNEGGYYKLLQQGYTTTNESYWNDLFGNWENLIDLEDKSKEAAQEALTGVSFDDLKNSFDDLVLSADTTFSDIADSFSGYMQKAILNFVKNTYLTQALKDWYDEFTAAMDDGVLTQEEKAALEQSYLNKYNTANTMYDTAASVAGIDISSSTSKSGLSGAIQGITEDTANLWVGQFNAIRVDIKAIMEAGMESQGSLDLAVGHLAKIEKNTNELFRLQKLEEIMSSVDRTLKDKL